MTLPARLVLTAIVPFGCGYFLSYLLRSVNAVVGPHLVIEFRLEPDELGLLTAAYLLAFSLFQLPLGVLLDRYGARRVQAVLLAIGGIGCLAFALASNYVLLIAARAVIGLGFSAGLMASYKANEDWIPFERRAFVAMAIMSMGALGVVVATQPTALLVLEIGWRWTFVVFAVCVFVVAIAILGIVPDKPQMMHPAAMREQWRDLIAIMKLPLFRRLAPMLAMTAGIPIAMQTLWAGPWFHDVMGLPHEDVARQLFWMAVSFMIGVFLMGVIADRLQRFGISPLHTMFAFLAIHLLSQVLITTQLQQLALPAWILLAAFGQCASLAFPWFAAKVGSHRAGRANAAINFFMFVAAFAIQYGVGVVLSLFAVDMQSVDPKAYAIATAILLSLHLASIAWYVFAPQERKVTA